MRFGVSYGNHGDGVHVEDVILYIRNSLTAAGEDAYILPGLLTDGVNVLLECFTPAQAWQISQIKRRTRARFVVVISEFTDGKRFNAHITSGEGHYVNTEYWEQRFETFMEVAAHADALWSLSEYCLPEYRALFPGKPVLSFPIGFDLEFPLIRHPSAEKKDIDLLFTGTLTPHRKMLVTELERKFAVMTSSPATLSISRIDLTRRAKASLHLNLLPDAIYSSVMRHHFLVMSGAAVVSERAQTVGPLDEFITQFDGRDFVDRISDYLASGEWKWRGAAMRERYRESRPVAAAMRQLLDESFQS